MKREEIEALAVVADRKVLDAAKDAIKAGGNGGQHRTVAAEWAFVGAALRDISRRADDD